MQTYGAQTCPHNRINVRKGQCMICYNMLPEYTIIRHENTKFILQPPLVDAAPTEIDWYTTMLANTKVGNAQQEKQKMNTSATKADTSIRGLMGEDVYSSLDEQQKLFVDFADRCVGRMREKGTDDSEESAMAMQEIETVKIISGIISNAAQILKQGYEKQEYPRTAVLDLANYAFIADQQLIAQTTSVEKARPAE